MTNLTDYISAYFVVGFVVSACLAKFKSDLVALFVEKASIGYEATLSDEELFAIGQFALGLAWPVAIFLFLVGVDDD